MPPPATIQPGERSGNPGERYFACVNGRVKGPMDLDLIEAFILSGHYPPRIQICPEDSQKWRFHPSGDSPSVARHASTPQATNRGYILAFVFLGAILIFLAVLPHVASISPGGSFPAASPPASANTGIASDAQALSTEASSPSPRSAEDAGSAAVSSGPKPSGDRLVLWNSHIEAKQSELLARQAELTKKAEELARTESALDPADPKQVAAYEAETQDFATARAKLRTEWTELNAELRRYNDELDRIGTSISRSRVDANTPPAAPSPPAPSSTPPPFVYIPKDPPTVALPQPPADTNSEKIVRGPDGTKYRVPADAYSGLSNWGKFIIEERAKVNAWKASLDEARASLANLKNSADSWTRQELTAYEQKVDECDEAARKLDAAADSVTTMEDTFASQLEKVGTPIRQ